MTNKVTQVKVSTAHQDGHTDRETSFARGEPLSSYLPANDPMTDEEWEQVCVGIDAFPL